MTLARNRSIALFGALAAVVYFAVFCVTRMPAAMAHPSVVGTAGLVDLVVTVPFLFYFWLIRRGYASWVTLIAVFFAGARASRFLLPASEQVYAPAVRWRAVPFELVAIGLLVRRLRRVGTRRDFLAAVFRNQWVADVAALEISVLYYGLLSWRRRPEIDDGYRAFSYGEAAGYTMFATILGAALMFEGLPAHLLLQRWSPAAAWVCTALDVYGFVWVLAIARSVRLCPILVGDANVRIRAGFIREVEFERSQIACVRRVGAHVPARREPGYLRTTIITDP